MVYIISIGDTVKLRKSGETAVITGKTVNKIHGEWQDVYFMDNNYGTCYTSDQFDLVEGQCKYY